MMGKIFTSVQTNDGNICRYGYGWELSDNYFGHKAHGHAGAWLGFTTQITHFHEHNLWVVVYSNSLAIPAWMLAPDVTQPFLALEGVSSSC